MSSGPGAGGVPAYGTALYDYVSSLRREGSPATRATSFLEAVNFTLPLLGLDTDPHGYEPRPRVRGAALTSLDRKGVTKQAPPMEVELVKAIELAVGTSRNAVDRAVAGFALFTLYSRSRGSDAARAPCDPKLDLDEHGRGYVEVQSYGLHIKTGRGTRRRLRMFPMVAAA